MLDMSWGEVMLIGGVALIVIGPKDLPKALRTLGQVTGKMRRMAGEFRHQFNEAIREADLEEIKREVEGVRETASRFKPSFNPVDTIRNELKGAVEGSSAPRNGSGPVPSMPAPGENASPTAIARASAQSDDAFGSGGSYDVPRSIAPAAQADPKPEASGAVNRAPEDRTP